MTKDRGKRRSGGMTLLEKPAKKKESMPSYEVIYLKHAGVSIPNNYLEGKVVRRFLIRRIVV